MTSRCIFDVTASLIKTDERKAFRCFARMDVTTFDHLLTIRRLLGRSVMVQLQSEWELNRVESYDCSHFITARLVSRYGRCRRRMGQPICAGAALSPATVCMLLCRPPTRLDRPSSGPTPAALPSRFVSTSSVVWTSSKSTDVG